MPRFPRAFRLIVFACLAAVVAPVAAAEDLPYREGRFEQGELKVVDGLPVLIVRGTPEEIGRQKAALTADAVKTLSGYPKRLLEQVGRGSTWPKMVERGRALVPQFPPDHRDELKAFAAAAGTDRDLGIVANTMVDTYRGGFGCSSLMVEATRSETKAPLFGRNLDFYTLGILEKYCLVTVHRPKGKHAFVSIGYPGMFGCLSGMNDAGLCVAVHEVFISADRAPIFNPKGMPYAFCFRRILEECTTISEAEKLLRSTERTTLLNLAVCDREHCGVLEMTPRSVGFRGDEEGLCACTNHFRTEDLAVFRRCRRYRQLEECWGQSTLGLSDVAAKLHEVNQGRLTVQTMVFEPVSLRLHLAVGSCPSSALPLKRLELGALLGSDVGDKDVGNKDVGDKDVGDKDVGDKDVGDKDVGDKPQSE